MDNRKIVAAISGQKLNRTLGLFDATAINIGAIIGAGIFVVTGIAAGIAGPSVIISIILAGAVAFFTALSFARLTRWLPREGSIYVFATRLLSPFAGFIAGWLWLLSNILTAAAVSLGFAHYLKALLPTLPANLVAAFLCLLFTVVNFFGAKQSALLNNLLVMAKMAILLFFIIFGSFYLNAINFWPFLQLKKQTISAAFYIFFAFGGFARVAVLADEVKRPRKNVPRAIIFSVIISTLIYVLVALVALGLVGAQRLGHSQSPLTTAMRATQKPVAVYIISAGGLVATASVLLTSILGVSRMAFAMAEKNDLPSILARLHPKYRTPFYAVGISGVTTTGLILLVDITKVLALSTFALLFYYLLANLCVLRISQETKLYEKLISLAGLVSSASLLVIAFIHLTRVLTFGLVAILLGTVYYALKPKIKS